MAAAKPKPSTSGPVTTLPDAQAHGYYGVKADPRPNSDYTLPSGPDGPPTARPGQPADYLQKEPRA